MYQNRSFIIFPAFFGIRTHDSTIDLRTVLTSVQVERCPSRPNQTSHSGAKCKSQITIHVPLTHVKGGATVADPNGLSPPLIAVQPIGWQPAPSSFCCSGASNEYSSVPIRPTARAPEAKMLEQTDIHIEHAYTLTSARLLFVSDPPEEIFEYILTHWSLYTLRF